MNWYDSMIENAKDIIKTRKSLVPVLMMIKGESLTICDMSPFTQNKDMMSDFMKFAISTSNPDEYLLMMESWIKVFNQKDESDLALSQLIVEGTLQVGQFSSSEECITVLHGDRNGERLGTVVFNRKNGKINFNPIQWAAKPIEFKGRFVGLRGN
jgi:hypothetical protein